MSTQTLSETDFNSPGYEFLRSYQNMSILYHKLVALNYRKEFGSQYKCPNINQYYFSLPNKNNSEQQFLFTCLCAWLIKDKCHMNFLIEPDEYQDVDHTIAIIFEALELLLTPDNVEEGSRSRAARQSPVDFPPARLKRGFGPEIIYTLNIFADRALELIYESNGAGGVGGGSDESEKLRVLYHNKGATVDRQTSSSITIGQPFVGGGLTTRPLGSYQIDDRSLLLGAGDDDDVDGANYSYDHRASTLLSATDESDWYQQVQRVAPALESANLNTDCLAKSNNWHEYAEAARESRDSILDFLGRSRPLLTVIASRVDRHLQVIHGRERFLQTNLKGQLEEFLKVWRNYAQQLANHRDLQAQVETKAESFESLKARLRLLDSNIELRIRELNDGSKLRDYEQKIELLSNENNDLKLRVGLLLTVYARKNERLLAEKSVTLNTREHRRQS